MTLKTGMTKGRGKVAIPPLNFFFKEVSGSTGFAFITQVWDLMNNEYRSKITIWVRVDNI